MNARKVRIPVYGLGRPGSDASVVERQLAASDGVLRASVDPVTEAACVDYDPAETDAWTLARAIEHAGYTPGRPTEI
jgi:copper chaperone CopZ